MPQATSRVRWAGRVGQVALATISVVTLAGTVFANDLADRIVHPAEPVPAVVGEVPTAPALRPTVTKGIPEASRPTAVAKRAMNILMMGVDSREGLTPQEIEKYHMGTVGGDSSDTIMVLHLYADGRHAAIISFPRDLYVEIPAWNRSDGVKLPAKKMKINAAYPRGRADGPNLAINTIENLTGIRIDHYLSVDVAHLGRIVNALGGVEVCLPSAINDPVRDHHGSGLVLSAGRHLLNDVEAVGYVRTRYVNTGEGDSDFGRIRRQQKFLSAILHQVLAAGTLTDFGKLSRLVTTVSSSLRMDAALDAKTLLKVAGSLQNLDPRHLTFATVPVTDDAFPVADVGDVALIDEGAAHDLFQKVIHDEPIIAPTSATTTAGATPSASSTTAAERPHTAADDPCGRSDG